MILWWKRKEEKMQVNEQISAAAAAEQEEKDDFRELLKAMAIAAVIALSIRTFLFEPFNIPSGSMFPTLLVGDYLFVEKYSYGYSQYSFPFGIVAFQGRLVEKTPKRGDVAVFRQPKKPDIDYIKRLIGLPGDRIQVTGGVLRINGESVTREYIGLEQVNDENGSITYKKYIETLPGGVRHYIYEISDAMPLDDTQEFVVPEGHYFAMGDNRDGSLDSRVQSQVGFVPAQNLVGRAWFRFFSIEGLNGVCDREGAFAAMKSLGCKIVTWPCHIRFNRLFTAINAI